MSNAIVVVNVTETVAPLPNTLQQSGAFISQGGTNTAAGTLTQVTTLAGLTAILAAAKALSSLSWTGSVVTGTTAALHGWTIGDQVYVTIAGASPAGYNGTFLATITGTETFTYPLLVNPGSMTVAGTVILADESELLQMGTTYFAGNNNPAVYVLELGESTPTEGVTLLSTWISNNPATIYSYLVPREWDGNSTFLAFLGNYNTPSSMTYFFVTTIYANINFYAGLKCVLAEIESPNIASTEFSLASAFGVTLSYNPNSTNLVTPLSFAPMYGVTPYPTAGNSTVLAALNTANVSYIGTGAEGGITSNILFYGQMQDGNPFNFWYSADWAQLNINLAISNEVINGSSNSLNPLYYNQPGINRLQNRAVQVLQQAVTNGLAIGVVTSLGLPTSTFVSNYNSGLYAGLLVINAESFLVYTQENPNDYARGKYAGLSCIYIPLRGFKQIFFNLNVTNLLS